MSACGCRGPGLRSYEHAAHERNSQRGLPPEPPPSSVLVSAGVADRMRGDGARVTVYAVAAGHRGGPGKRSTRRVEDRAYAVDLPDPEGNARWLDTRGEHVARIAGVIRWGRRWDVATPYVDQSSVDLDALIARHAAWRRATAKARRVAARLAGNPRPELCGPECVAAFTEPREEVIA